jgi:transcriptional regulator with XRE-family HTH domain
MTQKDFIEKIGKKIRSLRQKQNLTQEKLADLCFLDRTYIGGIERGERNFSLINLFKIANSLNVKPEEIVKGDVD